MVLVPFTCDEKLAVWRSVHVPVYHHSIYHTLRAVAGCRLIFHYYHPRPPSHAPDSRQRRIVFHYAFCAFSATDDARRRTLLFHPTRFMCFATPATVVFSSTHAVAMVKGVWEWNCALPLLYLHLISTSSSHIENSTRFLLLKVQK